MKGIAHFAIGVAAATCIPEVVRAGAAGHAGYAVLGGVCGLLPDTLDFKFARYFYRHDVDIVPDPLSPVAQLVADGVAAAFNRAALGDRSVRLKLNTIRLGVDRWRSYHVRFNPARRRVEVWLGVVVDTGGVPAEGAGPGSVCTAALSVEPALDYLAESAVTILDGPSFELAPRADGRVAVRFIPWHRAWSHSLLVAAAVGVLAWAAWDGVAGVVAAGGWALHALADQAGLMGGALWWPWRRERVPGWAAWRSGDTRVNLAAVWLAGLLILWNLWRAQEPAAASLRPLLLGGVLLPGLALAVLQRGRAVFRPFVRGSCLPAWLRRAGDRLRR